MSPRSGRQRENMSSGLAQWVSRKGAKLAEKIIDVKGSKPIRKCAGTLYWWN